MIRVLIRWSVILVVFVTTFFSWSVIDNSMAIALTEAEVLAKLRLIPVFVVVDQQGSPFVAEVNNQSVAGVFISLTDANQFLNRLKTDNSELAEQIQVAPVSLAEVYQLMRKKSSQEQQFFFDFIPNQETLAYAKTLLPQEIRQQLEGVPLFFVRGGEEKRYLNIVIDSQQFIPFFFDQESLEKMVSRYRESNPEEADTVDIQVTSLEWLIEILETDPNEMGNRIFLIRSTESEQFMQNLQQQRNN